MDEEEHKNLIDNRREKVKQLVKKFEDNKVKRKVIESLKEE